MNFQQTDSAEILPHIANSETTSHHIKLQHRRALKRVREKLFRDDPSRQELLVQRLDDRCKNAHSFQTQLRELNAGQLNADDFPVGLSDLFVIPNPNDPLKLKLLTDSIDNVLDSLDLDWPISGLVEDGERANIEFMLEPLRERTEIYQLMSTGLLLQGVFGPFNYPRNIGRRRIELTTAFAIELSIVFRRFTARDSNSGKYIFDLQHCAELPVDRELRELVCFGKPNWKLVSYLVFLTLRTSIELERFCESNRSAAGKYICENPSVVYDRWRLPLPV